MDYKKDLTYNQCLILNKIKNINNSKRTSKSQIAKEININPSHKDFAKVFDYLVSVKALEFIEFIGPVKVLKLNPKVAKDLLDEQEIINWWVDSYFKKDHFFTW